MLQPKVYIAELNKILEVKLIDFDNEQIEAYDEDKSIYRDFNFFEVEFIENTGMKDKNGSYIYEGDILEFHDEYPTWDYEGEVSACDGVNAAIVTKEKNCITLTNFQADDGGLEEMLCTRELIFDELNFEDYEIIGNIYENKDLLGVR